MKDFDDFMSNKGIINLSVKKIDLTELTVNNFWHFLDTKNTQGGRAFIGLTNCFP